MFSINQKTVNKITFLFITILITYLSYFASIKYQEYKTSVVLKKNLIEIDRLKKLSFDKMMKVNEEYLNLNKVYGSEDDVKDNLKEIFVKLSNKNNYIQLISLKKLCIDRYLVIINLTSYNEEYITMVNGFFNKLGQTVQSKKNDKIYYIDYIINTKEIK